MALSKKVRFEVFKRDGFTCQYCGKKSPDVTLEVDHIEPRCSGGSDEEINLITSFFDCNRGKGKRQLNEIRPIPRIEPITKKARHQVRECKKLIRVSQDRREQRERLLRSLKGCWQDILPDVNVPEDRQWNPWLNNFPPEEIVYGIEQVPNLRGYIGYYKSIKYASGVMWKRKREQEANG